MPEGLLVHLYFCLNASSREVVAAFSEYSLQENDQRYVKRAHHPDGPQGKTEWVLVNGAPEEMTSRKFDVYSMPIRTETAFEEYGFITAIELFAKGELTEKYLQQCANYIPHR